MNTNNHELIDNNYIKYNNKRLKHKKNKEFVTARVNVSFGKKRINISVGMIVCDLLNFKKDERVHIFLNKHDRDLLLIKKSLFPDDGHKLVFRGEGSSFLTFSFQYETSDQFRISQTIILDFDINDEKSLVVNIEKLKWRN